jgi:DNA-directed RNA polymerase specialized sigma24 family protein
MIADFLPDDCTKEELKILNNVAIDIYLQFNDPQDKFIIAMKWENGYSSEETAEALGVSYVTVYKRALKIEKALAKKFKIPAEVKI